MKKYKEMTKNQLIHMIEENEYLFEMKSILRCIDDLVIGEYIEIKNDDMCYYVDYD